MTHHCLLVDGYTSRTDCLGQADIVNILDLMGFLWLPPV